MKNEFLDPEYLREAVEASLQVKTGIRAGSDLPPIGPLYGMPLYGIEPIPLGE